MSVVEGLDWCFEVCGGWCDGLKILGSWVGLVFVVEYGGCGACEGEVLVGS